MSCCACCRVAFSVARLTLPSPYDEPPFSSILARAHLRVKGETARPLCASELCDAAVSWWVLPSVEVREAGGRPVLGHAVEEGAGDADEVPQVLDGARVCSLALRLHQRSGSVGGGGAEDGGEGEGEEGGVGEWSGCSCVVSCWRASGCRGHVTCHMSGASSCDRRSPSTQSDLSQ